MEDINFIRKAIADRYASVCKNIAHTPNQGIIRQLGGSVTQSLYLDFVYRGNDKVNFTHRMTDKDLILLTDALEPHTKVLRI